MLGLLSRFFYCFTVCNSETCLSKLFEVLVVFVVFLEKQRRFAIHNAETCLSKLFEVLVSNFFVTFLDYIETFCNVSC